MHATESVQEPAWGVCDMGSGFKVQGSEDEKGRRWEGEKVRG
jgi:hypothetical protein